VQTTKQLAFVELDNFNAMRAAVNMMRFDLSQSFHILFEDLGEENKNALMQNQPVPHSLFDGRNSELIFTSLSRRNYYANKKESEQTEISYFLQPKDGSRYPSLTKRESELIDGDLYSGGRVYSILDNVTSLVFQYWDEKQAKWVDDWHSDSGNYRDRFPYAVRMKLGIIGEGERKLDITSEFKLAFPNNDPNLVKF
jgi:Type II secretion system (T2SS), protein J